MDFHVFFSYFSEITQKKYFFFSFLFIIYYSIDNYQQKHDVNQAKAIVRPGVYEEIRKQVDEMLVMNLRKIQMQIAPKGKKKSKKTKSKKAKKSKKDKKKKPLPGEKIAELKGLDSDQMLSILIEHQLVVRGRERKLDSFIGDFNYLGSMHHNADRKDGNDECHSFFSFI